MHVDKGSDFFMWKPDHLVNFFFQLKSFQTDESCVERMSLKQNITAHNWFVMNDTKNIKEAGNKIMQTLSNI